MAHVSISGRHIGTIVAGAALFAAALFAAFEVQALGERVGDLHTRIRADVRRLDRCDAHLKTARSRVEQAEATPAPDLDADELGDLSETLDETGTAVGALEEETVAADSALEARLRAAAVSAALPSGDFPRLSALPAEQAVSVRAGVREMLQRETLRPEARRREATVREAAAQLTERLALNGDQVSGVETLLFAHLEALRNPPASALTNPDVAEVQDRKSVV